MSTTGPAMPGVVLDVLVLADPHPPPVKEEAPAGAGGGGAARAGSSLGCRHRAATGRARPPRRAPLRGADDARLVELSRAGDQRAFEVIIERYRPLLLRHCRRVAGEAGQDAVQQAFMSAWCALRGGLEVRQLRAWLFTIADHAALQSLRDQRTPVADLGEVPADGRSPEEQIEQSTRVRATLAAVAGLPPRERDALVWTSIEGRSGRDIARALGVSEAAARQLIFRARARARAAVSVLVPPAFVARLPVAGSHGARRLIGLAHKGLANVSSIEASEALVRLAPVLAAGALVAAPVAAVELGGHRDARPPRATRALLPGVGQPGVRRTPVHPTHASRAASLPPGAPAGRAGRQARTLTGTAARLSEGGNSSVLAARGQHPGQTPGDEQRAGVVSPGVAGVAPATLPAPPDAALTPVEPSAGPGLAGATELLAPAAASAPSVGQSATTGAEGLQRQAAGVAGGLPPSARQAPVSGANAPVSATVP